MMSRNRVYRRVALVAMPVLVALAWTTAAVRGQSGTNNGEWRTYGGDLGSTRYAPLDQINRGNFKKLEIAWRFKTDILGSPPDFNLQATPLMINGVLYTTAGSRRDAVAHRRGDRRTAVDVSPRRGQARRGVAAPALGPRRGYWTDGRGDERIFFVTIGYQLVGARREDRPARARVRQERRRRSEAEQRPGPRPDHRRDWPEHGAPVVAKDVVIVGAAHRAGGAPRSKANAKGYVRGFDVRTGKRLWIFHTIPQPGEFGNDTWENDSWSYTGNTGVWAPFSVDEELGLVYLPVEMPTGDYYGGHRPGNNLFGESLVAVDLQTGKRIWHYQLVHHGIWDYDIPCAPILADITVDGQARSRRSRSRPSRAFSTCSIARPASRCGRSRSGPSRNRTVPGEKTSRRRSRFRPSRRRSSARASR